MNEPRILARADFDGKLKTYLFLYVLFLMVVTVAGIATAPFWILGWGQWWAKKYFDNLECFLTDRALVVKRGVLFKVEKTIPLDKIQDLALREGPLLNAFGIKSLRIETAGQSTGQGASEASLVGVKNTRAFRDAVLTQRDLVSGPSGVSLAGGESVESLLRDIRGLMERMANGLEK